MISYSHVKLLPSSPVSLPKTFLLLLIITVAAAVSAGSAQAQSKDELQALNQAWAWDRAIPSGRNGVWCICPF